MGETAPVALRHILRAWGRIGVIGFGGPPAHIALLRELCVEKEQWLSSQEFEHAVATTGLLPGPASTQLAIYCGWRLRGLPGALVAGASFIFPGLIMIVALSSLLFSHHPLGFLTVAALSASAVVPIIALDTTRRLSPPSWRSLKNNQRRWRWAINAGAGAAVALIAPALVVVVLISAGLIEVLITRRQVVAALGATAHAVAVSGLGAVAWVAFKVGALSYGGGFVIVPLMQHDVVSVYHWMTGSQFLDAVALGQVTPGPVVLTTASVGYAAHGLLGATLATVVAFGPSFFFIIFGGHHFERLRHSSTARAFLSGAGPAVIGAIGGSSLALGLLIHHLWQLPVLLAAAGWMLVLRRSGVLALVVAALLGAAGSGVLAH